MFRYFSYIVVYHLRRLKPGDVLLEVAGKPCLNFVMLGARRSTPPSPSPPIGVDVDEALNIGAPSWCEEVRGVETLPRCIHNMSRKDHPWDQIREANRNMFRTIFRIHSSHFIPYSEVMLGLLLDLRNVILARSRMLMLLSISSEPRILEEQLDTAVDSEVNIKLSRAGEVKNIQLRVVDFHKLPLAQVFSDGFGKSGCLMVKTWTD